MLISLILTLLFVIVLGVYLLLSSKRKTLKNIYTLITNGINIVLSFILTKIISNIVVDKLSSYVLNRIINLDDWTNKTAINTFTKFIINMVFSILIFYVIYMILHFILHMFKRLIFKLVNKTSYKEFESKKDDNKLVNVVLGLGSFLIISFAFIFPLGSLVKVVNYAVKTTNYELPKEAKSIFNNPILKAYSLLGSETFFNQVTYFENEEKIQNTQELKGISTISFAFLQVRQNPDIAKSAYVIKEELAKTYLVPSFISELCSNAAQKWKNGEPFMGQTLEIPTDYSKNLVIELLNILSNWQKENLISDIDTMYNLYVILNEKNVKEINDTDELLKALQDEVFTEKLFLELFHNQDFKSLIPVFINFGIDTILDSLNMKGNGNYVNNINLDKMTDEDIKREAHNLSLTINELIKIKEYADENIKEEDIEKIINELKEIENSDLLNDKVYDILKELVNKLR